MSCASSLAFLTKRPSPQGTYSTPYTSQKCWGGSPHPQRRDLGLERWLSYLYIYTWVEGLVSEHEHMQVLMTMVYHCKGTCIYSLTNHSTQVPIYSTVRMISQTDITQHPIVTAVCVIFVLPQTRSRGHRLRQPD